MGVETNDTGLIWLCHVGKDDIDHGDEHAVFQRVASVLDDWDDICAVRGHVYQISAGTMRELDREDGSGRSNDISNVRHGCARGGSQVEHFGAGLDEDLVQTSQDTGCQLAAEGVPDAVFGLGYAVVGAAGVLDADALFAVHGFAGA